MRNEITIQKIADYIIQNAYTVNSPGLYNGKAGLSLSLFVASKYLQNEEMEEQAFHLIQEALVIKNQDFTFENGLSGIGYALLYLIEEKYLNADFDELFEEQHEKIINNFSNIEKDPFRLLNSLQTIYYLSKANIIKARDYRLQNIIKKIFEGLELFLTIQFYDLTDIHYINNKVAVLNIYETYLRLIDFSRYTYFSRSLLNDYATLYRKGRVVSSPAIGVLLNAITTKNNIKGYTDIIDDNIRHGIRNIHSALSLKERIDLMKLTNKIHHESFEDRLFPELQYPYKADLIPILLKITDQKSSPLGYGTGLGRFLMAYTDRQTELL